MAYTVNKLAKLSNVSVRTLHYYDKIELLKPSFVGDNDYRYYESPELLRLQQILFYRELGFSLTDIKKLLDAEDFDHNLALKSHRSALEKNVKETQELIKTIDKTIAHIEGRKKLRDEELYYGFDSERQRQYEQYLINKGYTTEDKVESSRTWSNKQDWDAIHKESDTIWKTAALLIDKGVAPDSDEAQAIMGELHRWIGRFWTPDRERFMGLTELYNSHPDFRKFYESYHENMLPFLTEAMRIYAERELS